LIAPTDYLALVEPVAERDVKPVQACLDYSFRSCS
jgi:hypothetical protein